MILRTIGFSLLLIAATVEVSAADIFLSKIFTKKEISNEERDQLFREAEFAVRRYLFYLDEADYYIECFLDKKEKQAWQTARNAAFAFTVCPAEVATKGIAALLAIAADVLVSATYWYDEQDYENLHYVDDCLARAAAWWSKYDKIQNRLLMDE